MALSTTSLTSGTSTANQASYNTASVAVSTGDLIVVAVYVSVPTQPADEPTITGPGTLVSKDSRWIVNGARGLKQQVFAVTGGGSGSFHIAGTSYNAAAWSVYRLNGANATTPVVQGATGSSTAFGTPPTWSLALPSAVTSGNGLLGAFGYNLSEAGTPSSGGTEIHDVTASSPAGALETQRDFAPADNALGVSYTTSNTARGIVIEVAAATSNQAPVADAGPDLAAQPFPNEVTLAGSVTDDGLPSGALTATWTAQSGPGDVVFADDTSATTTATFSLSGVYVLRLTADDGTASAYDETTVTVNLQPVVENVQADPVTVTIPDAVSLTATVSGEDGYPEPLSVTWSQVSGPGTVTFAGEHATSTTATFDTDGTYVLRLTVTDTALSDSKDLTVVALPTPVNEAPTVDAGADQGPTADLTVTLNGTATDDGLPSGEVTKIWAKLSGPGEVAFGNARALSTTATFSEVGTYVLRLTVTDGELSSWDDVTIEIDFNQAPVVDAGVDQSITLPATASLSGTASDDGLPSGILTVAWSQVSGPGTVTFADETAPVTTATFSADGTYVLRLTADDSARQSTDDLTVTVAAAPAQNTAPVVSAGPNQSITLPDDVTLDGTVSDDGLPNDSVTTTWSKFSGPGTVTFGDVHAVDTTASFSVAGSYVLRLTADDGSLSTVDNVAITVAAAPPPTNTAPTVNAGTDASVTMPSAASLNGTVSDDGNPSGSTLTSTWSKVSGPGVVTFGNVHAVDTTATFSQAGTYVLRLTATDGALSTSDTVSITVSAATPPPPTTDLPYTSGSFFKSRVDGSATPIDSARTTAFRSFMKTHPDQKAVAWPKMNVNPDWAMSYHVGVSTDPIWKLTGGNTGDSKIAIAASQGFHMADSVADTFPTGTQDRPGVMVDPVFGYTIQFADAVPNKANRTINVSNASVFWHDSNGLDYRNPATDDSRNSSSRGRIPDAMVIRRDILDWAVQHDTGLGHVLHLFFVETRSSDGFCHPMTGAEGGNVGFGAEGERIRLKPSIDLRARGLTGAMLAIGRTLQQHGGYIGDNSGGATQIKASQPQFYVGTNVTTDGFKGKITWDDFEVVEQGYQP